jgi:transposase
MVRHVGVDVGKAWLDVALLDGERVRRFRAANDATGHAAIAAWLAPRLGGATAHVCLEATGAYGFAFARAMHEAGHRVSLVNPAQIKAFGGSELLRTKTDKVDAALNARFCRAMQPPAWAPPPEAVARLRELVRRCAALKAMRTQEINRLRSGAVTAAALASVERTIAFLEGEIEAITVATAEVIAADTELAAQARLLASIPGLGSRAVAVLLGELPNLEGFAHAKKVAAFVGIAPGERSSGTRQPAGSPISRVGNGLARATLVLCALSARRHNPILRRFADRLAATGKPKKVVLVAVARKLLTIAHGVTRHRRPFDPEALVARTTDA